MRRLALTLALILRAQADPAPEWSLAANGRFEVYSQAGGQSAAAALAWFEQLRAFFLRQTALQPDPARPPVRVIEFRSAAEFRPYRLRPSTDAYYVGTESRDYIVLPAGEPRFAAHEYAHLVLRSGAGNLPPWLNEGMAEFFSSLGGDLPARAQALRRGTWIPLADLLALPPDSPLREARESAAMFYAESWALTSMLLLAPEYRGGFRALAAEVSGGNPGARAFQKVYGRPLETVARDLKAWAQARRSRPIPLPELPAGEVRAVEVPPLRVRDLLGELLLLAGALDRAEAAFREGPQTAGSAAGLGIIALRRGDPAGARREWAGALERGIADPWTCYRYALLADAAGLPSADVRPALERAVELKPDFDDARYELALTAKNQGDWQIALAHLRAMRAVPPARAYHYWSTVADTLNELGRREEARTAARQAAEHAATPDERAHAAQLAWVAQSDVVARFARDEAGRLRLETTRVPHDSPDWNPFVEPGDRIRRVEAPVREIECGGGALRLVLDAPEGPLRLSIPDPSHVRVRNGSAEFTCGPQQQANRATVVYAASDKSGEGIVRGIDFQLE